MALSLEIQKGMKVRDYFLNSIGYILIQSLQNFRGNLIIFCTKQSFDLSTKTTRKSPIS